MFFKVLNVHVSDFPLRQQRLPSSFQFNNILVYVHTQAMIPLSSFPSSGEHIFCIKTVKFCGMCPSLNTPVYTLD